MSHRKNLQLSAAIVFALIVTACGGGGGSGGGDSDSPDYSSIALPDIEHATQKQFTRDNAKQALIVASNFSTFIDSNASPYPLLSETTGEPSMSASRPALKLRGAVQSQAAVNVSDEICVSGEAVAKEISATKFSITFSDCDTDGVIFNGMIESEIMDPLPQGIALSETTTLRGLRLAATDQSLDVVFDGTYSVMLSDRNFGELGEIGMIRASLDVRDLQEQKGASLRNYESSFELVSAPGGGVAANLLGRQGTVYDENSEYFDISTMDPGSDASLILSSNVIEYVQLQSAIRYMMSQYPEVTRFSLHGLDSDLYVIEDASSDTPRLQLDLPVGECGEPESLPGGFVIATPHAFPFAPDCYLRVDPDALTASVSNDLAPALGLVESVSVASGQYYVIPHLDVVESDQQFVDIRWELVSKPEMSSPLYFAWNDGFLFVSYTSGVYTFRVTVNDGALVTERTLTITVFDF